LGHVFEYSTTFDFETSTDVAVRVDFRDIILYDNEEDGMLSGTVNFILYKGNHYHLTVLTADEQHLYLDTNDIWDDGDHVGISIAPESIKLEKV
jgi:spermidine/putrescine transport system ATP-binding protein